ncbi:MAG: hypothetical protein J5496_08195 [Lachnospiraceae bacterium]|nr:hypothetical protein [Lachnospiraceae bacterium]
MKKNYRIADKVISVDSLFESVHLLCRDYLTEEPADFAVRILPDMIEEEQEKAAREAIQEGRKPRKWSDAYLEELAVYRKIAEKMPEYDTVLIHGSAVAVDDEAYLFTAPSGTGKSTHTRLWRELFGERAVIVNDDKPLLRIGKDQTVIYGTPYDGKHHLSTNIAVPLKAICFLKRGRENHIRELSEREVFQRLFAQVYRPEDSSALQKTLELLTRLIKLVSFYELTCNMDPEAALVAYEGMNPRKTAAEGKKALEEGDRRADRQF